MEFAVGNFLELKKASGTVSRWQTSGLRKTLTATRLSLWLQWSDV